MANIEQIKKIIPVITREISFGQDVCELVFGVNVTDLDSGDQIDPVTQPIQSNSVGSWNMPHCGLRPLITILITASLSSKTCNIAAEPEHVVFDGM